MAGNSKPKRKKTTGKRPTAQNLPKHLLGSLNAGNGLAAYIATFSADVDRHLADLEKDTSLSPEEKEKTRRELMKTRDEITQITGPKNVATQLFKTKG